MTRVLKSWFFGGGPVTAIVGRPTAIHNEPQVHVAVDVLSQLMPCRSLACERPSVKRSENNDPCWRLAMKRFIGTLLLLVCAVAFGAYAGDTKQPRLKEAAQKDSAVIPKPEHGEVPLAAGTPADKPKAVSREGVE